MSPLRSRAPKPLYTLVVEIANNQMETLKEGGFNLCVAKKANGAYTVVWSGKSDYLHENTFSWEEDYQVFGLNKFKLGALVKAETNEVDIAFGQTCTLDSAGVMSPATGPTDDSGVFTVKNEFGKICLGVNQKLNGTFLPVFVSPTVISGTATFEPIVEVKVWLQSHTETSTMIFNADEPGIEVSYAGDISKTVAYEGKVGLGQWVQK
ncbi:hypothetical protein BDQ12DRAFT_668379 [Crucibulum laeve]|uniref:Uncharacterized protein n=1 Tax=Crucibulum laeve TaxID=68775 RepID=A0A5C3LUJ5_9AGAR|nr:hypothetical protein BDQ12DRAFT_668379 [Crucibulum laeve]